MTRDRITDISRRLEDRAEAVCRHYLNAGKRRGNYWQVGDLRNSPGKSMYVRLVSTPGKPAGKWHDAATGEHGDLFDIIRQTCNLNYFPDVLEEAERFLGLPVAQDHQKPECSSSSQSGKCRPHSKEAARRLFALSKPIGNPFTLTLAETFLTNRGITRFDGLDSLRFHPRCYYRPEDDGPTQQWPAMIAAVTDCDGAITGAHRTWLARDGSDKAPLDPPRKAMGNLNGNGVRFGKASRMKPESLLLAGEGIETVLSLRQFLAHMPMVACLAASHLAAFRFSPQLSIELQRLYIACDRDEAGIAAGNALAERAASLSIQTVILLPRLADFNDDLRQLPREQFADNLRRQMIPQDYARFLELQD